MSGLAGINPHLIRRYGRTITIRREKMRISKTFTATSRKYKPEELIGSQQQNVIEFKILDEDIRDTPLCFPQKYDRVIDHDQVLTVENAEPINLQDQLIAWKIKATG